MIARWGRTQARHGANIRRRVKNEVFVSTMEQLRSSQLLTYDADSAVVVDAPIVTGGDSSVGAPITVHVTANLSTFTSNVSVPFFWALWIAEYLYRRLFIPNADSLGTVHLYTSDEYASDK